MSAEEAYEAIAKMAETHGLILEAAGGLIVVMHPRAQIEAGVYGLCQYQAGLGPHPDREDVG